MSDSQLLHATAIMIDNCGVLLLGKSGSGKSDLALRLIENNKAVLIADDVVKVVRRGQKLYAEYVQNIAGLLEVRGVGLVRYPYIDCAEVKICVNLSDDITKIERLPEKQTGTILGLEIAQIDLYAKENSAPAKILAAVRGLSANKGEREQIKC